MSYLHYFTNMIHQMLKKNKYLSHVIITTLLSSYPNIKIYRCTTIQCLEINVKTMKELDAENERWYIYFEQQPNRITAVRSVDGLTSMNICIIMLGFIALVISVAEIHSIEWDRETSEFNGNRGILHLFFT
ncbi:hypothetical protein T10_10610, partial [Trichinella papuae]